MLPVTPGYAASRAALGFLQPGEAPSASRKELELHQCGVGEASLETLLRFPESSPAPLQPARHSCLELQLDLQQQLLCEVQAQVEADRPLPASKWRPESVCDITCSPASLWTSTLSQMFGGG